MLAARRCCQTRVGAGGVRDTVHLSPGSRLQRSLLQAARAKKGGDEGGGGLTAVTDTVQSVVNAAADLVPESVPRPVAKGGVAVVGALILFGLLKQVISGIFTLVVLGAVGYWWLTKDSAGADDDDFLPKTSNKSSSSSSKDEDLDDPLSESRRIMDKYK